MKNQKNLYSVGINNQWTTKPVSKEYIQSKNISLQKSRNNNCDMQGFKDSKLIAWFFISKSKQMKFLKSKNLI